MDSHIDPARRRRENSRLRVASFFLVAPDRHEFGAVAKKSIHGAADRSRALERGQRGVDLGPARPQELRQLALREIQFQRCATPGRFRTAAQRRQKETREPGLQRIQCDVLQLVTDIAEPLAKEVIAKIFSAID